MAKTLEFHEAADIFPLMTDDDFDELVEDIRTNGLRETIKVCDGKVLDGRNRYRACLLAGVERRYDTISPDDPIAYVLSLNLHRRHLEKSQRAMIGARAAKAYEDAAKERKRAGGSAGGKAAHGKVPNNCSDPCRSDSRDAIGVAVGTSGPTIDRAKKILAKAIPEVVQAVDAGEMSCHLGSRIAALDGDSQREVMAASDKAKAVKVAEKKVEEAQQPATGVRGVGVYRANEAIDALKRIPLDDPLRKRGFQIVSDWIKINK